MTAGRVRVRRAKACRIAGGAGAIARASRPPSTRKHGPGDRNRRGGAPQGVARLRLRRRRRSGSRVCYHTRLAARCLPSCSRGNGSSLGRITRRENGRSWLFEICICGARRRPRNPSPLWGGSTERADAQHRRSGGRGGGAEGSEFVAPLPDRAARDHPPHKGEGESAHNFFFTSLMSENTMPSARSLV